MEGEMLKVKAFKEGGKGIERKEGGWVVACTERGRKGGWQIELTEDWREGRRERGRVAAFME